MFDLLRKYMDSLAGITELSRERAEQLVRELHDRGEVRARDVRKASEELVRRSLQNRRELVRLLRKEVRRQVDALGLATKDDVERLSRRVRALESAKPSGAKKKAAAKKPAPARKATER